MDKDDKDSLNRSLKMMRLLIERVTNEVYFREDITEEDTKAILEFKNALVKIHNRFCPLDSGYNVN